MIENKKTYNIEKKIEILDVNYAHNDRKSFNVIYK